MLTQPINSISEAQRLDAFCRELGLILRRILKESQEADQSQELVNDPEPIEKIELEIIP